MASRLALWPRAWPCGRSGPPRFGGRAACSPRRSRPGCLARGVGGAFCLPARQGQAHRGTVQRLAPFSVGSFSPRGFRPADGAGRRHFGAGICAPTSRTSPSTSVWPWFLCCLPGNGSLGVAVAMQPRFDSVAHPPHPSASHQPCSPAMFRIYAHALRALCSANQSCCPLVGWLLVSMATALSLTTALLCLCHKRLGFPSKTLRTATEFAIGAVYFRASTSPAPNCGCRHTWLG